MNYYMAAFKDQRLILSDHKWTDLRSGDMILGADPDMSYMIKAVIKMQRDEQGKTSWQLVRSVFSGYDVTQKARNQIKSKELFKIDKKVFDTINNELTKIETYDQYKDLSYLLDRHLKNVDYARNLKKIFIENPQLVTDHIDLLTNAQKSVDEIFKGRSFQYPVLKEISEKDFRLQNTVPLKDDSGLSRYYGYDLVLTIDNHHYAITNNWYFWKGKNGGGRASGDTRTPFVRWLKEQLYLLGHDHQSVDLKDESEGYVIRKEEQSVKEEIERIKTYIRQKGFTYDDGLIENFYLCLKSKPFVILAGISGTGKTRLVQLFAEAMGATRNNQRFTIIPVHPDWSDSSDLLGHENLEGRFLPGVVINTVKKASEDLHHPYFICLDEMNLARVEYYFSDFLSVIETRDRQEDGHITTIPLIPSEAFGEDEDARAKYQNLTIPENLYLIGTVNMDDSTYPFSAKVLDRANTIEFSEVHLIPDDFTDLTEVSAMELDNSFLKAPYLKLIDAKSDWDEVKDICHELESINNVLRQINAHVGYRIRDEIVFYMLNNKENGLLSKNQAFDYALLQKILPRLKGSTTGLKDVLCQLFKIVASDYEGANAFDTEVSEAMMKKVADAKYPMTAKKIAYMVRRFDEDGYTSYWL